MKLKLILGCLISAAFSLGLADDPNRRTRCNGITDGNAPHGKPGNLLADAALSTRYLLVKRGSDAGHFAVCGASDCPLGPCMDEPSAAEIEATISLLGAIEGTIPVVGSEAIAVDEDLYTAANGKVQNTPAAAGTYWRVGRSFTACSGDGDTFRMVPCFPQKVIIVANASNLAATQGAMAPGAIGNVLGA